MPELYPRQLKYSSLMVLQSTTASHSSWHSRLHHDTVLSYPFHYTDNVSTIQIALDFLDTSHN